MKAMLRRWFGAAPSPHEALEQIYREHARFVWRSARHLGVPPEHVDDVVHDVFLIVHRRFDAFEGRGSIRSWLFGITRRVVGHHRRSASRYERRKQALPSPSEVQRPDDRIARIEAEDAVERFLTALDPRLRMVFSLVDIEGMQAPEVATALGIELNTVYSRLRRARRRFAEFMQQWSRAGGGIDATG